MKKTFKLLGIFMGVFIVVIVGGLGGYFLISQNKTYYIYDVRLVEPISNAVGYVYTDSELEYTSIKNKTVYMKSNSENRFQIAVFAYTSTNTTDVVLESSDSSVAKIIYSGTNCYIEYLKEGETTISASIGVVKDSFNLYVYNEVADSFSVYDNTYYGNFAPVFSNKIISYSDMTEYRYDYKAIGTTGDAGGEVNNSLLKIDQTKLNFDVFDKVYIDAVRKQLVVKCKSNLDENKDETIVIQSYYNTGDGEIKISQNYYVQVHIVAYTPEFLQVELATTPDFENGQIFMNTTVVSEDILTDEVVEKNPEILETFLSYQKAENNLINRSESSVYQTLFTEKVSKIYLRFRKVYTNGDVVYLTQNNIENNPYTLNFSGDYLKLSANKEYYTLEIPNEYFVTNPTYNIVLTLSDFDLSFDFKFEFASLTAENLQEFYAYNKETKVFTYKYWDPRTHYDNEIYDTEGNIVGFGGLDVDLSLFD